MKILMGIGNELRGDDAVGIYIAKNFKKEGWKTIIAGQVPEDFTSEIKRVKPELLVLVDAALMGLEPGEIRIVPVEKIPNVAFSTHGMPLSFFISYVRDFVGKVILIGIQPKQMEFGMDISTEVKKAAQWLLDILRRERLMEINTL
jgi:hydrogenase 3 maturation protease